MTHLESVTEINLRKKGLISWVPNSVFQLNLILKSFLFDCLGFLSFRFPFFFLSLLFSQQLKRNKQKILVSKLEQWKRGRNSFVFFSCDDWSHLACCCLDMMMNNRLTHRCQANDFNSTHLPPHTLIYIFLNRGLYQNLRTLVSLFSGWVQHNLPNLFLLEISLQSAVICKLIFQTVWS